MTGRYERQSFLGKDSERIHGTCIAGVIGLGGGGSHIAQQLAYLGVDNFLLIDPDDVEESNLNRLVGGTAEDAKRKHAKVYVSKRLIKSVSRAANVRCVRAKWQEHHHLLRGCDVIFGCVDSYGDRAEIEAAARRYLIPYIDIGMDVHAIAESFSVSGQAILSIPGLPCMRCMGFLRDELIAREAEGYGAAGHRPQVVWANGLLASAAVTLFTQLLTPWQTNPVSLYLEYDGDGPTLTTSRRLEYTREKSCEHFPSVDQLGDPFWTPNLQPNRALSRHRRPTPKQ